MMTKNKTVLQDLQTIASKILIGTTVGVGMSKPVPVVTDKSLFLRYLVYGVSTAKNSVTNLIFQKISKPVKWAEFRFMTNELTREVKFDYSPGVYEFCNYPDAQSDLIKMTADEYNFLLQSYEELYLEMIMSYFLFALTKHDTCPIDRKMKFNKMFTMLSPEILKPYYHDLNADFFNWTGINLDK